MTGFIVQPRFLFMHSSVSARRGKNVFRKNVGGTHLHKAEVPLRRRLDPERWDRLMHWLGPDDIQAGQNYTGLHAKLIYWFERRGCKHASECADETFNCVAEKIGAVEIKNPWGYLVGVAKNILLEYYRERMKITSLDDGSSKQPSNLINMEKTIDNARIL